MSTTFTDQRQLFLPIMKVGRGRPWADRIPANWAGSHVVENDKVGSSPELGRRNGAEPKERSDRGGEECSLPNSGRRRAAPPVKSAGICQCRDFCKDTHGCCLANGNPLKRIFTAWASSSIMALGSL
jgi:hypothetical protein